MPRLGAQQAPLQGGSRVFRKEAFHALCKGKAFFMERLGRGSGKKSFFVPQSCMFLEGAFLSLDGPGHRPRELRWFHCQAFVCPCSAAFSPSDPSSPCCSGLPQLSGPSTHRAECSALGGGPMRTSPLSSWGAHSLRLQTTSPTFLAK